MNIHTYGTDERLLFCREYLLEKNIQAVGNIILLPIPTSVIDVDFDKISALASSSLAVVGYNVQKELREALSEMGACVVDVSQDERFLTENAELTAVGAVCRILNSEPRGPKGLSVGVIGYGRIGSALLRIMSFLGARVTVFTSKEELSRDLCMMGISSVSSDFLSEKSAKDKLSKLDILINTAPAKLLSSEVLRECSEVRIIELASGNNFPNGFSYERMPSIPARMYPRGAGLALGDSILRILGEQITT